MKSFKKIYDLAAKRKGSEENLQALLPPVKTKEQINLTTDDRVLSLMSQCIFQAGFSWKVVDKKWPEFEQVFKQFQPEILQFLSPENLEELAKDRRIIRNMQKIVTIPQNAQWICEIAETHGSFANFLTQWPRDDQINLFKLLKTRGARLGGNTGPRFLRNVGLDCFILTKDVLIALADAKIDYAGSATSIRDQKVIQSAFNSWHQETQIPYTHLSKILAYSAGDNIA